MKIAFLFGSLNRGGTETLMLDVCRYLNIDKYFEAVGIYRKPGVLENDFKNSGVLFRYIPVGKNPLSYLIKLRRFIKRNSVTVLHAHQPLDAIYAYFAIIGLSKKIILSFHGFDFNQNKSLVRYIISRTDRNIFVSQYQREYYISKYKLKENLQRVVCNGIDFSKFNLKECNNPGKISIRKELAVPEKSIVMGMVGNFNIGRDQMTICRFLNLLNKGNVDFHFLFIGKCIESSPERYDECVDYCQRNNLSDRVHFLGLRQDVPAILNELDAFVYSTEHDTFGIAVIEAIAAGIPVFVNDWEVMKEITEGGKLATLYKSSDETDLLQKIMLFLQDSELYKEKARQASAVVRKKYSIQQHIEKLKLIYKELLQ